MLQLRIQFQFRQKQMMSANINYLSDNSVTVDAGYISHAILANIRYISQKLDDGFSILK